MIKNLAVFCFHAAAIPLVTKEAKSDEIHTRHVSYLDRPRIHFAGRFRADTATTNNYFNGYINAAAQGISEDCSEDCSKTIHQNESMEGVNWNPMGTGAFSFYNVSVTSVCPPRADCTCAHPLVTSRTTITTEMGDGSAKMADVDLEWQMSPHIYGLTITLVASMGQTSPHRRWLITGDMRPSGVTGIWKAISGFEGLPRYYDLEEMPAYVGSYQSVLDNVQWNNEVLDEISRHGDVDLLLEMQSKSKSRLSISFTLYGYNLLGGEDFTYGYLVGTIGLADFQEPTSYVRGRCLHTRRPHLFSRAQFILQDIGANILTIDFGNALKQYWDQPTRTYHLNVSAMGSELCLARQEETNIMTVGNVRISDQWYTTTAGVQDFYLSHNEFKKLQTNYLHLVNCSNSSDIFMSESHYYVRPMSDYAIRMDPGDQHKLKFFVTKFGIPVRRKEIRLVVHPHHTCISNKWVETPSAGVECQTMITREKVQSGLKVNGFNSTVISTNEMGEATVMLSSGNPGNVRGVIDGLVYLISYLSDDDPEYPLRYRDSVIGVRVFDSFSWNEEPTWHGSKGVYNILKLYDDMFPAMRAVLKLGEYDSVVQARNIEYMKRSLSLPRDHPHHMPSTRDLSRDKRIMLLQWLNQPYPPKKEKPIPTIEELRSQVQLAVLIEHYTIPAYLYPLYSIKDGTNQEISEIILSVVIEEMLHLSVAANILNAIGGQPNFESPSNIPKYPSKFPGNVQPALTLRLSPLSLELITDMFMRIETPESLTSRESYTRTIGGFYTELLESMWHLETEKQKKNETIFTGNPARQVQLDLPDHIMVPKIENFDEAKKAIEDIIIEGEGYETKPINHHKRLAHYYRFAEIAHGKKLLEQPNGDWNYTGEFLPAYQAPYKLLNSSLTLHFINRHTYSS